MFCPTVATASTGPIDGPHRTPPAPAMITTGAVSANLSVTTGKDDPLVKTWFERIKGAERHWAKFHQRVRRNRRVVRHRRQPGSAQPGSLTCTARTSSSPPSSVVLAKVHAKNSGDAGRADQQGPGTCVCSATRYPPSPRPCWSDAKLKTKAKRTGARGHDPQLAS